MRPSSPCAPTLPAMHAAGDPVADARHSGMGISLPLQQLQHDGEQPEPGKLIDVCHWSAASS
jgi:hypothetical protein